MGPIPVSLECLDKSIMHTLEDSGAQDGAVLPLYLHKVLPSTLVYWFLVHLVNCHLSSFLPLKSPLVQGTNSRRSEVLFT